MQKQKKRNLLFMLLVPVAAVISIFFYRELLVKRSFHDEVIIAAIDEDTRKLAGVKAEKIIRSIVKTAGVNEDHSKIKLDYPFYGSIFPPEIVAPTFLWHDTDKRATLWLIEVRFKNDPCRIYAITAGVQQEPVIDKEAINSANENYKRSKYSVSAKAWRPERSVWETIKQKSVEDFATVMISGITGGKNPAIVSRASTAIKTSKDPVGAPVFYRDVPLMPSKKTTGKIKPLSQEAQLLIKWRLRDISKESAPVLLKDMPTCANCHTFSLDGKILGMDMDGPDGDKGAYGIKEVEKEMVITSDDIMSWNSYKHMKRGKKNIGFFSQVSPDGKYVISTLNESVSVHNYLDFRFLQSFYPTRGVLAIYYRDTGKIKLLSGADDPNYVQANGCWSPDGKKILFSRALAKNSYGSKGPPKYAGDPKETFIQYDLCTIPFNEGRGGKAKVLLKASDHDKSNSFAKYSPDGKWIVFVQSDKGQLMRPNSKLCIMPAGGGKIRQMDCNLPIMNSWHSWSPNSKWLVFSSKGFRPFTQMFLTHIDEKGNDSPAILIPNSTASNRAVNIPEFLNNSVDAIVSIQTPTQESYRHIKQAFKFTKLGKYPEAMAELETSLSMNPYSAQAYHDKGFLLYKDGKTREALECMEKALELNPDSSGLYTNYGIILESAGKLEEAISKYKTALEIDPKLTLVLSNLAGLYKSQGKLQEAENYYRKVLEIEPRNLNAHEFLSDALLQQKNIPGALEHCYHILKLKPQKIDTLNKTAWLLATTPGPDVLNPSKAVKLAQRACKLTDHKRPELLDTLAAAFAVAEDFDKAVDAAEKAIQLADAGNDKELAGRIQGRLDLYKQGQAYRDHQLSSE